MHGRLQKFVESASIFSAPSVTSTTQLKRLVNDSGAHDETLCELLDAVRNTNNGVGEKARLALKRAAESRIKELCVLKEQVEVRVIEACTDDNRSSKLLGLAPRLST